MHFYRLFKISCQCWGPLAPAKSCSPLPIPTWLLKRISTNIFPMLYLHLCNLSFQHGTFPAQLKQARVTPRLKKPCTLDPDTANSYRHISNLSSKLEERLIAVRFTGHANLYTLLFPAQQFACPDLSTLY